MLHVGSLLFLSGFLQGVLEAVRISMAGYPTRKTYHEFVDRFGLIALDVIDGRWVYSYYLSEVLVLDYLINLFMFHSPISG